MTDEKFFAHLDYSDQDPKIPDLDQSIRCPDHPNTEPEDGYGLGGGGIGIYTFCPECGKILSKMQDPEMQDD